MIRTNRFRLLSRRGTLRLITLLLSSSIAAPALVADDLVADDLADHVVDPVTGVYLEARTSDVFTGPCFANSEINLEGKEAIMAWRVDHGSWQGVDLENLSVVAVLRSRTTLGDPSLIERGIAPEVRSLLVVDERARSDQKQALVHLARAMAPGLLEGIEAVETAPVSIDVGAHGAATLLAGTWATVDLRGLHDGDHLCGNEIVFYPPLAIGVEAHPGVTLEHRFDGPGLGGTWRSPGKRSSFAGTFTAR